MMRSVTRQWKWCLVIITFIFFTFNAYIFYPGFMSYDSLQQLSQAKGINAYSNWHPPIMAFLWSIGITVTGKVGLLLLFQLLLLWSALFICSLIVYKHTKSQLYSLIPLLFGFLPFIISISGVIWKDVHMAAALLLASCLAIASRFVGRKTVLLFATIGTLLLVYALMLRYNAILAVIPILYLFASSFIKRGRRVLVAVIGILLISIGASAVLGKVLNVRESNPTAAIMLDDIVHTTPKLEIEKTHLARELIYIKEKCSSDSVMLHALLYCTESVQSANRIQNEYFDEIKQLWINVFLHHFPDYVMYRAQTFGIFLTSPEPYTYVMHQGIDPNTLGQEVSHPGALKTLRSYIGFANHDFGLIFRPYFWLLLAAVLFVYVFRQKKLQYRTAILCLTLSAIVYIVGYVPLVIGADYRYIYWSVFATCLAFLLLAISFKNK